MSHQVYIYIVYTVIHHWFVPNPGKSHWQDLVDQTVWKHLHCWTSILDNPRHISLNCMNLCQTTCRFICRNRCAMEQHQCISEYTGNWESFLVVGLNFIFPYIGNFIIPTDEVIFFRGVGIPPTSFICSWCPPLFATPMFGASESQISTLRWVVSMAAWIPRPFCKQMKP